MTGRHDAAERQSRGKSRPLCCGRTFLSAGLVEEARAEARRVLAAAAPYLARGMPIVGLEPSCLLTLRDEFLSMLPGAETERLASHAFLLEEFLAREAAAGRIPGPIGRLEGKVLLHGHCHQKAFGAMGSVGAALALVEGLEVETVESSCCGMAGAFGYGADTHAVSMAMGELTLLPAVRRAAPDTLIAADGFSCRHQIRDGTGRQPRHVARILQQAMSAGAGPSACVTMPATAACADRPLRWTRPCRDRLGSAAAGCKPKPTRLHRLGRGRGGHAVRESDD